MISVPTPHGAERRERSGVSTSVDTLDFPVLPSPLTSLVGRTGELEEIAAYLDSPETRLLTLVGPGGVGKTRLALRAGRIWADRTGFPVALVDLAAVTKPGMVRSSIASTLGVQVGDQLTLAKRLHDAIGDRWLLLVVDNFEHVIAEAHVVVELLAACPHTTVLVTSRRPLRFQGEQEFDVLPLQPPASGSVHTARDLESNDAARLFLQRALATTPNLRITDAAAQAIAEICQRLDGLPLALELASARIKLFAPEMLLHRLAHNLDVLTDGPRDLPSRQRTIRDAISWSYDLLTPDEQIVFQRVAMFAGSFSLNTASDVIAYLEAEVGRREDDVDLFDVMYSLVDKSLISRQQLESGEYRFRMLETIREFGMCRLRVAGELDPMRASLLRYYSELVVNMESDLIGPDQARTIAQLDGEIGTIRFALMAALELPGEAASQGLALATALWRYWLVRGQIGECAGWLTQLLESAQDAAAGARALALNRLGNIMLELGQHDVARIHYLASLQQYRSINDESGEADEINNLGLVDMIMGNFAEAKVQLHASLAMRRRLAEPTALPATLSNLGDIALYEGQYALAEAHHREALGIRIARGYSRGISLSLFNLGVITLAQDNLDQAEALFNEALGYSVPINDLYSQGSIYIGHGRLFLKRRDLSRALTSFANSLAIFRQMGVQRLAAEAIDDIAAVAVTNGYPRESALLVASTRAMRKASLIGFTTRTPADAEAFERALNAEFDTREIARLADEGSRISLDKSAEDALVLVDLIASQWMPIPATANAQRGDSSTSTYGLTVREREVLALLVTGVSDKEIAEALFISPRTAMTHVGNIMTKLGVRKRGQAVNLAIRTGLVVTRKSPIAST